MRRSSMLLALLLAAACLPGGARAAFPEGWLGSWSGECEATGAQGIMRFGMQLEVSPREGSRALGWRTTYRMEERGDQVRDYVLKPTNNDQQWLLDERNGILLDTFSAGDVLYQNFYFPTSARSLTVRFERRGDELDLDIPTFLTNPGNPTTGPGGVQVVSFHLSSLQRCHLTRE